MAKKVSAVTVVTLTDSGRADTLLADAMFYLWSILNAMGEKAAREVAAKQGDFFAQRRKKTATKSSMEDFVKDYVVSHVEYGNKAEGLIQKDKGIIDCTYCKLKKEVIPKVENLIGKSVFTMCEYCQIVHPPIAKAYGCDLDISITPNGCLWTVKPKTKT